MQVGDILALLLGGGAVATISALFNGVKALREGSRAREKDTVSDLVEQRKEAWEDRDFSNDERDYWRSRAARAEFELERAGKPIPKFDPPPVKKSDND